MHAYGGFIGTNSRALSPPRQSLVDPLEHVCVRSRWRECGGCGIRAMTALTTLLQPQKLRRVFSVEVRSTWCGSRHHSPSPMLLILICIDTTAFHLPAHTHKGDIGRVIAFGPRGAPRRAKPM